MLFKSYEIRQTNSCDIKGSWEPWSNIMKWVPWVEPFLRPLIIIILLITLYPNSTNKICFFPSRIHQDPDGDANGTSHDSFSQLLLQAIR